MKKLLVLLVTLPLLFQCSDNDRILNLPENSEPYYAFLLQRIGDAKFIFIGDTTEMPVYLESIGDQPLTGFNLSVVFEDSALNILDIIPGEAIECWEIFEYTTRSFEDEEGRHLEQININAVADVKFISDQPSGCTANNGSFDNLPDELFTIRFEVSSDWKYNCSFVPVNFYWLDCNDNTINDDQYDVEYVSRAVYEPNWYIISHDEYLLYIPDDGSIDANDHVYGIFDNCLTAPNHPKIKESVIDFYSGGVDIACQDPVFPPGDLNLNNVRYEIGDAVVYSNYFIYGESIFTINLEGQIAESDVNEDGKPLTLADFCYLIRIITGDSYPFEELENYQDTAYLLLENDTIYTKCHRALGGAYMVFPGKVKFTSLLGGFEIKSGYVDGYTKILIYNTNKKAINPGLYPILKLNKSIYPDEFETAGYRGEIVTSIIKH